MMHLMPTPEELLVRSRTVAVVGFSTDPDKPSHNAPMLMVERGWTIIPVNPNAETVAGLRSYPTLADIPSDIHVDLVNVFRRSEQTPDVVRAAAAIGADAVWLQLGIRSAESRAIAQEAGMDYVEDLCAGALAKRRDLRPHD